MDLFDFAESEARKKDGMDLAAINKADRLEFAREIAVGIARQNGQVTADDVGDRLQELGLDSDWLGPAAGSLFCGHQWTFTGTRVKSKRKRNHARELKVWKYAVD